MDATHAGREADRARKGVHIVDRDSFESVSYRQPWARLSGFGFARPALLPCPVARLPVARLPVARLGHEFRDRV